MNFWTFLDRNSGPALVAVLVLGMFGALSIGSCNDSKAKQNCTEQRST